MTHRRDREFRIPGLTRVEGEGALHIRVDGTAVTAVELNIYEPPRFFEALLRGRGYLEPPDITARICGICPVSHLIASAKACDRILAVRPPKTGADLRALPALQLPPHSAPPPDGT